MKKEYVFKDILGVCYGGTVNQTSLCPLRKGSCSWRTHTHTHTHTHFASPWQCSVWYKVENEALRLGVCSSQYTVLNDSFHVHIIHSDCYSFIFYLVTSLCREGSPAGGLMDQLDDTVKDRLECTAISSFARIPVWFLFTFTFLNQILKATLTDWIPAHSVHCLSPKDAENKPRPTMSWVDMWL